jgi:hypothetical protein
MNKSFHPFPLIFPPPAYETISGERAQRNIILVEAVPRTVWKHFSKLRSSHNLCK